MTCNLCGGEGPFRASDRRTCAACLRAKEAKRHAERQARVARGVDVETLLGLILADLRKARKAVDHDTGTAAGLDLAVVRILGVAERAGVLAPGDDPTVAFLT